MRLEEVISEVKKEYYIDRVEFQRFHDYFYDIETLLNAINSENNRLSEIAKRDTWDWCGNVISLYIDGFQINVFYIKEKQEQEIILDEIE